MDTGHTQNGELSNHFFKLMSSLFFRPAVVDGVQVAFPHDHELVFERLLFRNALCPECLVLDFQQVLYSGVFVHCCN